MFMRNALQENNDVFPLTFKTPKIIQVHPAHPKIFPILMQTILNTKYLKQ